MNRRLVVFAAVVAASLAAFLLLAGARDATRPGATLVASIHPLADIVRNVAGPRFTVDCLLPSGASPHTFEPTARQIEMLSKARLFFQIGLDLELWASRLLEAASLERARVVTVSEGIEPLRFGEGRVRKGLGRGESASETDDDRAGHEEDEEHDGHEHGLYDPHVWLDPVLALAIVGNVEKALCAADAEGAAGYAERASSYREKLRALDAEFREALSRAGGRFVTFHNAYAYLARRYGLEIVGVVEESPGKEPGARRIAGLVRAARERGAAAILVEPQFSPRSAEAIARDAGVRVAVVDPLGDPADPRRATYLELMRFNLRALVGAGGEP